MVWYIIRANILLIVNVILTDGIRMFLNTIFFMYSVYMQRVVLVPRAGIFLADR